MNSVSQGTRSVRPQSQQKFARFGQSNRRAAVIIGVIAVIAGFLVGRWNPLLSHAASVEGADVDTLFSIMLGVATVIFVVVQGGLIYSIVAFRRHGEDDDSEGLPVRGHFGLEVLWTAIPAALVTATALYSYLILAAIETPKPDAIVVDVTGRQFAWQFYYPSLNVTTTQLSVPVGEQVHLRLKSLDVIHQFWVPDFRVKRDVMPDRVTDLRFTANREGQYAIRCTKIFGAGHAAMTSSVVAMPVAQFDQWLAQQAQLPGAGGPAAGTPSPTDRGKQVFEQNGCAACHTLKDAGAAGQVGPSLDGIGARAADALKDPNYKGQAKTAQDFIHESIVNPNVYIAPGYQPNVMPQNFGQTISASDLDALVQYLSDQK